MQAMFSSKLGLTFQPHMGRVITADAVAKGDVLIPDYNDEDKILEFGVAASRYAHVKLPGTYDTVALYKHAPAVLAMEDADAGKEVLVLGMGSHQESQPVVANISVTGTAKAGTPLYLGNNVKTITDTAGGKCVAILLEDATSGVRKVHFFGLAMGSTLA